MAASDGIGDVIDTGTVIDDTSNTLGINDQTGGSNGTGERIIGGFRGIIGNRGRNASGFGFGRVGGKTPGTDGTGDEKGKVFQSARKPPQRRKSKFVGVPIDGALLAPLMQGIGTTIAKLRAPKGPDGVKRPLVYGDPPALVWSLTDDEALSLGTAVGAFGKYLPMTAEQSAIAIDAGNLANCLFMIAQQRLMMERLFIAQMQQSFVQNRTAEHQEANRNGATDTTDATAADRRGSLYG